VTGTACKMTHNNRQTFFFARPSTYLA